MIGLRTCGIISRYETLLRDGTQAYVQFKYLLDRDFFLPPPPEMNLPE